MSTPIDDGGPAFPRAGFLSEIETPEQVIAQYENKPEQGMTLRDYFAGQALAGILSSDNKPECDDRKAEWAYSLADSMLFFRKESNT